MSLLNQLAVYAECTTDSLLNQGIRNKETDSEYGVYDRRSTKSRHKEQSD